jgi:hypothetical protein
MMAKTIGALSVGMSLSIGDFVNNMAKAKNHVSDFGNNVANSAIKVQSSIKGLIAFTSGALASYGIYKFYDRAIEAFTKTEEVITRIRGLTDNIGLEKISSVLEDIASKGRIAMDVAGSLATKMLSAGINSDSTAQMLESFGNTAKVAGAGASEVFNKLGEISLALMSTGEVNAQSFAELASMGLPVYEALAQRLSKVTGEAISAERAMAMLAGGQVSGTNALNALVGLSGNDKVKAQAEAQANTLSGIYAQLAGEIEGFFATMGGAIAEALDLKGFNKGVIDFIRNLKDNFETSLKPAIETIGSALAAVRDVLFVAFNGLVQFFARMGEADGAIGGRISNVREMVMGFAQGLMGVLAKLVDFATQAIEKLLNLAGGTELASKYFKAIAGGATVGAGVGSLFGGIGAPVGAMIGGLSGALGVSMSNERGGGGADLSAFRKQAMQMFSNISDDIGRMGSDTGDRYLKGLMENIKDSQTFFSLIQISMNSGAMGFRKFLDLVSSGTATVISGFRREMELGNMSVEQFESSIEALRQQALDALINAFSTGKITSGEFDAEMKKLQATFDSLKPPPDIIAPFKDPKLPDWIQQLADQKSPLDTYREKLSELQDALALQLISPEKFAEGATMLADELERAVGSVEALKNPGALLAGSREAFSQVLKIQNQGSGENPQQRLARLAERANELAQQQARTQEQILAATLNNNPVVTATFGG